MSKYQFRDAERVKKFYDTRSVAMFNDAIPIARQAMRPRFADAAAGLVLEKTLTYINPKIFEKRYPGNVLLNLGLDVDNSGGVAEIIQSLRTKPTGSYAQSSDRTSNKHVISLSGENNDIRVYEREATSTWNDTEVKQAAMQNISLIDKLIGAHNEVYLREVDEIGLVGKTGGPSTGLLNYAGFTSESASDTAVNLTGQELYDEIKDLIVRQHNGVANTEEYMADTVIMPVGVLNLAQSKILNSAGSTSSVLAALKGNFPGVTFVSSARADSVSGTSRTVAFNRGPDAMVLRIPQPFELGEIIRTGSFAFKFDTKYRVAGLDILESTSGQILTGL